MRGAGILLKYIVEKSHKWHWKTSVCWFPIKHAAFFSAYFLPDDAFLEFQS